MTKSNFLIYGSYGYTGNLIAELACQKGLKPVLAGRNKEKLLEQANRLGLEYRVFDLGDPELAKQYIKEFVTVIHCAGPFIQTYTNMVKACIETNTHYMDITGEYQVIEELIKLNELALASGIMILPGAGFDVVPSDCLAQHLKSRLPDATQLILAIHAIQNTRGNKLGVSRGTARTVAENLSEKSMIRDEGKLKTLPSGWIKREFDFGGSKPIFCTTISWGDLASAWWSTRIPHIETYMSTPDKLILLFKIINPVKNILKWKPVKQFIQNQINKMPEGPSSDERKNSLTRIYGEVMNNKGTKMVSILTTPNGYELTALSAVHIVKKTLAGNAPIGFQTPSTAYTKDLVLEIPGVTRVDIT